MLAFAVVFLVDIPQHMPYLWSFYYKTYAKTRAPVSHTLATIFYLEHAETKKTTVKLLKII